MPTVLRVGPFRFFFYSSDGGEPMHIHVEAGDNSAKLWLDPVRVARAGDFSERESRQVEQIVSEHIEKLVEAWHDYFDA